LWRTSRMSCSGVRSSVGGARSGSSAIIRSISASARLSNFSASNCPFCAVAWSRGLSDDHQNLSFDRAGRAEMTRCLSPRRVYTTVMNRPSTCPVTTIRLSPHGRGSTNCRTGPPKICAGGARLRHLGVKIDVYDLSEDGEVSPAACANLPGAVGAAANGRSRAVPCRFPAVSLLGRLAGKRSSLLCAAESGYIGCVSI
jgi:hypothetical protein